MLIAESCWLARVRRSNPRACEPLKRTAQTYRCCNIAAAVTLAGIAVDWESGRMISVDFVDPASTLVGNSVALRTTARLWDVSSPTYKMTSVIDLAQFNGLGLMDAGERCGLRMDHVGSRELVFSRNPRGVSSWGA